MEFIKKALNGKLNYFRAANVLFHIYIFISGTHGSLCTSKETCATCIAESPLCAWCAQENFQNNITNEEIPRCNFIENLESICDAIVSPKESIQILKNMNLSDKGAIESEAIQIKPQKIKLRIRPNSVQKFTVEFRQAVDYPVDLYYLMDLSNSMEDDKDKLAELGDKLADEMSTITRNFRLGFGSFVDKTVAPYVSAHPFMLQQPCPAEVRNGKWRPACAAPYGFHNDMPLNSRTKEFAKKVRDVPISGNLDAPEGGFDAIMQAIVCREEIGWRNQSRKLLVLSTDNGYHYAGDGKLGGIIKPNDEKCHLDHRGSYTMSTQQDYPSLSQLSRNIRKHKMNLIFAVTKEQVAQYEMLNSRFGSTTGKLENDSSNIVALIREQYNKITSSVKMTDNAGDSSIIISYFTKCFGDKKEEMNICTDLKVGTNVTFEVAIQFNACPADRKLWNRTFDIFPLGLNEHLTVDMEMVCECDCEKPWNEEPASDKCTSGNGTFECGICDCNYQRYGKECECDGTDTDSFLQALNCHNGEDTEMCSGAGECLCGKCRCNKGPKPGEEYSGKYCECNNFLCDKKDGKLCNGADHGRCECGKCKCTRGWKGPDCNCRDTTETCISPDGQICSGRGRCDCGSCECDPEQEYFGKYCDDCSSCPGMCKELQSCVEHWLEGKIEVKNTGHNSTTCDFTIIPVDVLEVKGNEKLCAFEDSARCRISFKYVFDEKNSVNISARRAKDCPAPLNLIAIVSGVSGTVVGAGLFLLLLWKLLTTIHDRRELAKFEKERLIAKWQKEENPIYVEAVSTFRNPTYGGQ